MQSRHLSENQIAGLEKIGDTMLPGFGELPSFSRSTCVRHVDRVLDYMAAHDLSDLKLLLTLMAFMPRFLIGMLMRFLEWSPSIPGPIGSLLRFMRLGMRCLVMTLYYCDPKTTKSLGYEVMVYTGDLVKSQPKSQEAAI